MEVGATTSQISKSNLLSSILFIPDINTQFELIEVDNKIQQFAFRLDELKGKLWEQPNKSYKLILKELKSINQVDKLENWIDKLPFPISSILWLYYATTDEGKKIEHLFNFFEAYSEFMSMLILSALRNDKDFYERECKRWTNKEERFKEWYLRADFGSWNALLADLSKSIRIFIGDKENKQICLRLLSNPTSDFLSLIQNSKIVGILEEVRSLRNEWKGHPGITPRDLRSRVDVLEQKLNKFRTEIGDGFEGVNILSSAKDAHLADGLWTFTTRNLIGAKSPFREIKIQTILGLDINKLYLQPTEFSKPIELLPFIKYKEENEAIYFYSKIESINARWVSYHFDKETELKHPADNELFKAFDFLKQRDKNYES